MEYALVTVRAQAMHWQADMELPAGMKIRELAVQILETLKLYDEERFYGKCRESNQQSGRSRLEAWDYCDWHRAFIIWARRSERDSIPHNEGK